LRHVTKDFKELTKNRINNQIRTEEVRLIEGAEGMPTGLMKTVDAIALAAEHGLDLIEITATANPPIAKIMDYGKFEYEQNKKQKEAKAKAHKTETKSIQIKIATGDHDLELKAKKASEWLAEGHRVKVELYLVGRSKYTADAFKKERLDRVLNLITENYKIAEAYKPSPRGVMMTLERDNKKV
jgi:translation initiation factor IF-3